MGTSAILAMLSVVLLAALAGACAAWWRARGSARRAAANRAAFEAAERQAQERVAALEARVRDLEGRTWIEDFPSDTVYRLVARAGAELDGGARTHGLVRDERGRVVPFLTAGRMTHLEDGDWFAAVRGQLVKLDPADLEKNRGAAAPPPLRPPPAADEATVRAEPPPAAAGPAVHAVPELAAADDDRTVLLAPGRGAAAADPDAGLAWLEAIEGHDLGKIFRLPFSGATIGRDAGNVVALGDGGASRVHCRVEFAGGRFVVHDNGSTNGTLCNDEPITEHELAFGDVVQVADTKLRYTCEGFELSGTDPAAAIAAFERTLARQPDFVTALKNLAFLLEKDVARNREAQPLWERLARLEASR